jgi:hypothetical protein
LARWLLRQCRYLGEGHPPGISFIQDRFGDIFGGFAYPENSLNVGGWFGGDIVVDTATVSVPDASSSLMLLSGACAAFGLLRRKLS